MSAALASAVARKLLCAAFSGGAEFGGLLRGCGAQFLGGLHGAGFCGLEGIVWRAGAEGGLCGGIFSHGDGRGAGGGILGDPPEALMAWMGSNKDSSRHVGERKKAVR
jgi:hypothetical protein